MSPYEAGINPARRFRRPMDVVGAVGMTGLATGPHLDYRMTRNGAFVDPIRIQSPPAEPVAEEDRPAFDGGEAQDEPR